VRRLTNWTDSFSLLTKAIAASVLLAVLVAGTFVLLLITVSDLRSSTNAQTQSRDFTTATLQLQEVVNQLEVSLRSFVVSDNDRFLISWRQARRELPPAMAKIGALLKDDTLESQATAQLSLLLGAYVTEYGLPLIKIARLSPDAARSPVATREGVLRINTIRMRLDRLLTSEEAQASGDAASAKQEASRAIPVAVGALLGAAGLLMLYGLFLARRIAGPVRTVAAGASRVAAGDLSTRLPEGGAAEIHALTSAFNTMAGSLERGKRELEVQNEELRQSERLKSQLVSIVSHELRTPLASILGYASLLRTRTFGKSETDRYLEIIQQQGNRLTSLIDHFLDGESVEAGRIELEDELVDLRPMILQEARLMGDKVTKHRIEIVMAANTLPVRGDRDRLAQVFVNLLGNAVKYSPDGGIVEIVGDVSDDTVRVEVRDQGIGVPDEHQPRIFTKFFRGDARESGIAGTGLGLAVSREIVEAHGGRIGFESSPGVGSHFWFELPLAPGHAPTDQLAGAARAG
jgi:signal transduction histidine kinase